MQEYTYIADKRKPDIRIMHTQITPKIRVSTAGIYYPPCEWGERFQYETFIFSDDPSQRSQQIIHGSDSQVNFYYLKKSVKIHRYISNNLKKRFKK